MEPHSSRDWLRALGISALCGIAAIAVWFVAVWATRGMPLAATGAFKQARWLLPVTVLVLSPVIIAARRSNAGTTDSRGL